MIRPLELFIGLRYLRAGRGSGLVSFMSVASFLGIALGVGALIVILSAMNGLEAESRNRLLSLSDHISVRADPADVDFAALEHRLESVPGVASVAPFVRLEAMLSSRAGLRPAIVRGIDPSAAELEPELAAVIGSDRLATLIPPAKRILLGRFVALSLRVEPGDRITLWRATTDGGRLRPLRTSFIVSGVFEAGVEAHDANLALTHISDAADLLGLDGAPQGLAIRLDDPMQVASVQRALVDAAPGDYEWSNWAEENRSLFRAMSIEKTMMTILLLFIAGIAAFNIVASLNMVVNDKAKDIAILRTMGLEPRKLTKIFLIQGALIGIGGTLAGLALGLGLAANLETILPWIEQTLGFQIMPGDVYYVTQVPSEIRLGDVILVPSIALVMALLATIYPSRRAARVDPAEVLRYE